MTDNKPRHIAFIMDGNGRWATRQGLPRAEGHRKGAETVEWLVEEAAKAGIDYITLYCLSSENWKRPKEEIDALMFLLKSFLISRREKMMTNRIRLKIIGRRAPIPEDILQTMDETVALTANNTGLTLILAINYGSRAEILDAVHTLVERVNSGALAPSDLTEEDFSRALYTENIPDPDLLVRTAGEMRLSNFLLWQLSYSEIFITDKCWPEFSSDDFYAALQEYARRTRRFGAVVEAADARPQQNGASQ